MKNPLLRPAALLLAGLLLLSPLSIVNAADHNDAPDIMGADGSLVDITDLFAFRSPANPANLVIAVGLFAPEVAVTPPLFDSSARYNIYIDTDRDFRPDVTITTRFSDKGHGQQEFSMSNVPGAGLVEGTVSLGSAAIFTNLGDVKAFCGLRDDHFFFDLTAFKHFVAEPCVPAAGLRCPGMGAPEDFFAGRNTSSIIVEFPLAALPGISANSGNLHIWAKTFAD